MNATRIPDPAENGWHVDRRIPVALVVTIVGTIMAQTFGFGIWISTLNNRVGNLELFQAAQSPAGTLRESRIIVLETNYRNIDAQLGQVSRKLDQLLDQNREPRP